MALTPFFITGITDAEGSFSASVSRNPSARLGYSLSLRFNITMHLRDSLLIKSIRKFFNDIGVYKESGSFCYFDVNSTADLKIIIEHFLNYPLLSSKRNAFYIFKLIYDILKSKQHLNPKVFILVLSYINILNKPIKREILSEITSKFGPLPDLITCPVVNFSPKINLLNKPWWIAGFVCGEGSFTYYKAKKISALGLIKTNIQMGFECSQQTTDYYLLKKIWDYFGVGQIYTDKKVSRIRITQLVQLQHVIIPFFSKYSIYGFKQTQYNVWLESVTVLISEPYGIERTVKLMALTEKLTSLSLTASKGD